MNKTELLNSLQNLLSGLPEEELQKSLDFYSEMVDDRVEDGMSEEDAVAALGEVKEIADKILSEVSISKLVRAKVKKAKQKSGIRPWMIVCLVLGFPVWFPLALVALILIFVFYLVFWILMLVLYIVDLSLFLAGIGSVIAGIGTMVVEKNWSAGWFMIGSGLVSLGLCIPLFPLCGLAAKGLLKVGKKILLGIKQLFVGRNREPVKTMDAEADKNTEDAPEVVPAGGVEL